MKIIMPQPQGENIDQVYTMVQASFAAAETYYFKYWLPEHVRRNIHDDDWDEATFTSYARLWLVMLYTWDHMHGQLWNPTAIDPNVPGDDANYNRQLADAMDHDFEQCLTAMFG